MKLKILVFLFPTIAFATDIWIQGVGITPESKESNFTEFYQSSADFGRVCAKNSERVCKRFINVDPAHAREVDKASKTGFATPINGDLQPMPETRKFLQKLEEMVQNSKEGHQIFISLQDHGSPGGPVSGTSCVSMGDDSICTNDLKKVLEKRPAGVRVGIVADACFTGGFTELASENVCLVVGSDQYTVGHYEAFLPWLADGKIKSLSDFKKMSDHRLSDFRLGSDVMRTSNCQTLQQTLQRELSSSDTEEIQKLLRLGTDFECEDGQNPFTLAGIVQIKKILKKLSASGVGTGICERPTEYACEIWTRLNQFIGKFNLDHLNEAATKVAKAENKAREEYFEMRKDPMLAAEAVKLDDARAMHRLKNAKFENVNDAQKTRLLSLIKSYEKADDAKAQFDELLKHVSYKDVSLTLREKNMIGDCILFPSYQGGETADYWEKIAMTLPKKTYSQKEIEQAEKCESSFHF